MRTRSTRWSAVAAIGLIAVGCRPKVETATASPEAAAPAATPTAARRPAGPPAAVAAARAPVDLLPEGTGMTVTVASVRHLLRVVDVGALITTYRPYYEQVAAYLEQSVGHNLLDPGKWSEIGVDADGPLGGALLDARSGASCLFFTLTDPPRFREFLDRMSAKFGGPLESVYEDRGTVLAHEPGARNQLVLRDNFAFLVMVSSPSRAPYDFAHELASVDPARGLAASQRWQQAFGPAGPRDLVAFVDIGGMVRAQLERERQGGEASGPTWAEQELQRLREQGAAAEEIARWEKVADEERAMAAQLRERRRRSQELWGAVFGPLGPLVVELSLDGQAIAGTTRVRAPESALLRRVVRADGAPPLAITAASERVLFGTGGNFDVAEGMAALDALLRAEGSSLDALFAELKRKGGGDLRGALELLDGALSFALTTREPAALAGPAAKKALGFNLALGFKDPVRAEALVAATMVLLQSSPSVPGAKVRRGKAGEHVVSVPQWREVHVAVAGSTLTISTDPKFAQQVQRAPGRPWEPRLARVAPIVTAPEAAAVLMVDHATLMTAFMARDAGAGRRYTPGDNHPYWRFPSLAHAAIEGVPRSAAYRAKLKEWQRLDAKIARAEQAQQRRRAEQALAAADSLGTLAVHLRETGDGLQTEGGQYFGPGGLAGVIERAVEGFSGETDYSVHEQRGRVEQELQEIRVRDVERALGVRAAE